MASFRVPEGGLSLYEGSRRQGTQIFVVSLPDSVAQELIHSSGKNSPSPKINFGRNTTLSYGKSTYDLNVKQNSTRQEVYRIPKRKADLDGATSRKPAFAGAVTHRLSEKIRTAGDLDIETLKNQFANLSDAKKSRNATIIAAPMVKGKKGMQNSPHLSAKSAPPKRLGQVNGNQSIPTSPSLRPVDTAKEELLKAALRSTLIPLLAIGPNSEKNLAVTAKCRVKACMDVLPQFAYRSNMKGEWALMDNHYGDIDIYGFGYTDTQRKKVIQNSKAAYDRMNLAPDHKFYRKLIPEHDRAAWEASLTAQTYTPRPDDKAFTAATKRPHEEAQSESLGPKKRKIDEKSLEARTDKSAKQAVGNILKKTKNAAKAASKSSSTPKAVAKTGNVTSSKPALSAEIIVDSDEEASEVPTPAKATRPPQKSTEKSPAKSPMKRPKGSSVSTKALASNKETTKELDKVKQRGQPKATEQPANPIKKKPAPTPTAIVKPSSSNTAKSSRASNISRSDPRAASSSTSPPKPSPLGSSPPMNASDFEKNNNPRILDSNSSPDEPIMSSYSPIPMKRRIDDSSSSSDGPIMKRKLHSSAGLDGARSAKRMRNDEVEVSSATLELAKKFKHLYSDYQRLYLEVSTSTHVNEQKKTDLLELHYKLAGMKHRINSKASPRLN